jgi:hypothetical protein
LLVNDGSRWRDAGRAAIERSYRRCDASSRFTGRGAIGRAYRRRMTNTRYGHSNVGGGDQDQPERKDEGWERRQAGAQSREPGRADGERRGEPPGADGTPPRGTNTQGELAGIGDAARRSEAELGDESPTDASIAPRDMDLRGAGTDQPPRMGGPLGGDPEHPHLPEGAQDSETRGSGAGGFDRGVDAKKVGAVHQGVREEAPPSAESVE